MHDIIKMADFLKAASLASKQAPPLMERVSGFTCATILCMTFGIHRLHQSNGRTPVNCVYNAYK